METFSPNSLESARIPIKYFANLFSAGNEDVVTLVYKKLAAVRVYKREQNAKDLSKDDVSRALREAELTPDEAEGIYRLTSLPTMKERFVIPPMMREQTEESAFARKAQTGAGFSLKPRRGW